MSNKCDSLCFVPAEWTAPYKTANSMERLIWFLKNSPFCSSFLGGNELTNYALCNKSTILLSCCDRQKLSFEEIHHMLPIGVRTGYIWSTEYQRVLFNNCSFSEKNLGQFQWTNVLSVISESKLLTFWKPANTNSGICACLDILSPWYAFTSIWMLKSLSLSVLSQAWIGPWQI